MKLERIISARGYQLLSPHQVRMCISSLRLRGIRHRELKDGSGVRRFKYKGSRTMAPRLLFPRLIVEGRLVLMIVRKLNEVFNEITNTNLCSSVTAPVVPVAHGFFFFN